MENQHRKITGYRELNQTEVDLMNLIKEHGENTKALLDKVYLMRCDDMEAGKLNQEQIIEAPRCLEKARTHLQEGQMWFVRSVALPDSF